MQTTRGQRLRNILLRRYIARQPVPVWIPKHKGVIHHNLLNSLMAFWPLDEASGTRKDAHSTNHLSDNGTVTQAAGKVGNAGQFTALNTEYLNILDNPALSTGDIDFCWAGWVYADSFGADRMIVTKATAVPNREYTVWFDVAANRFQFRIFDGTNNVGTAVANSLGAPSTGTWYFIVAWHNSVANTVNISVNNGD
mgnify:CR=1 FL=1